MRFYAEGVRKRYAEVMEHRRSIFSEPYIYQSYELR